jgi:hypothetical protein
MPRGRQKGPDPEKLIATARYRPEVLAAVESVAKEADRSRSWLLSHIVELWYQDMVQSGRWPPADSVEGDSPTVETPTAPDAGLR